MDGVSFFEPKPPKDWNERIEMTKSKLAKESVQWRANLNVISGQLKVGAEKVKTNAKSMTQKAKEKEIGQKMGQRLSMVFKKKNKDEVIEPNVAEDEKKYDEHF